MELSGTIVRKRTYFDQEDAAVTCILFLQLDDEVNVNGDSLRLIPILSNDAVVPQTVGEKIVITGRLLPKKIITPFGNIRSSPIPILLSTWQQNNTGGGVAMGK